MKPPIDRPNTRPLLLSLLLATLVVGEWQAAGAVTGSWGWTGILQVMALSAGSLFLVWLGEKITEVGVGNGISLLIMAGIVADLPVAFWLMTTRIWQADPDYAPLEAFRAFVAIGLFVAAVAAAVFVFSGRRRIPVEQRGSAHGNGRHYMPLKLSAAGALPVILAQSTVILLAPFLGMMAWDGNGALFPLLCFAVFVGMLFFFTRFWTALLLDPAEIAKQMEKYGTSIPGIERGHSTASHLAAIIRRITPAGAAFLAFIALALEVVTRALDLDPYVSQYLAGGVVLIVAGVALDLKESAVPIFEIRPRGEMR